MDTLTVVSLRHHWTKVIDLIQHYTILTIVLVSTSKHIEGLAERVQVKWVECLRVVSALQAPIPVRSVMDHLVKNHMPKYWPWIKSLRLLFGHTKHFKQCYPETLPLIPATKDRNHADNKHIDVTCRKAMLVSSTVKKLHHGDTSRN